MPELQSGRVPLGRGCALLVHGGAWDIPDEVVADHLEGLREAVEMGRKSLERGAPAVEVVAGVVSTMEQNGAFDAGRGSVLTDAGTVEMDAGIMDGESLRFGAVARLTVSETPVRVARVLLEGSGTARLLAAGPADRLAAAHGLSLADPGALIHPRERARYLRLRDERAYHTSRPFRKSPKGTVGCVARDDGGHMAAATSTGGTPFRPPGRVGDSPLPGCGYYADRAGAASATGWGEAIAAAGLSGRAVAAAERGEQAEDVVRGELARMASRIQGPDGAPSGAGLILIGRGTWGAWAYTTPRMARAGWSEGGEEWMLL